jgi:hypothetical protein
VSVESVDLPAVHAATHSEIEMALDVLNDGRPALVVIEKPKLRDWAEMANTLVGMTRASGHCVAMLSDSSQRGSRRWRRGTRSLVRLRAFLIYPWEPADPSTRASYKSDGNTESLEVSSAPMILRRRTE